MCEWDEKRGGDTTWVLGWVNTKASEIRSKLCSALYLIFCCSSFSSLAAVISSSNFSDFPSVISIYKTKKTKNQILISHEKFICLVIYTIHLSYQSSLLGLLFVYGRKQKPNLFLKIFIPLLFFNDQQDSKVTQTSGPVTNR